MAYIHIAQEDQSANAPTTINWRSISLSWALFSNRNCIGQNFAMNEIKVVIAQTLKRYQLIADPARPPKVSARLVLCSLNGIYIKIKPL